MINPEEYKIMNYEIVNLNEKILMSLKPSRISNNDPEVSAKISKLWGKFMTKSAEIENPKIKKAICTYSNYESDEKGLYDVAIGLEITKPRANADNFILKTIPAGKYAKFIVKGPMQKSVPEFWKKLWGMNLPRKFDCDFEEYQIADPLNSEVHIFISLK